MNSFGAKDLLTLVVERSAKMNDPSAAGTAAAWLPSRTLPSPAADRSRPIVTEWLPLAIEACPWAKLSMPLAVVRLPNAALLTPLAVVKAPIATLARPLATVLSPNAELNTPLAVVFLLKATRSLPIFASSQWAPVTEPARNAAFLDVVQLQRPKGEEHRTEGPIRVGSERSSTFVSLAQALTKPL